MSPRTDPTEPDHVVDIQWGVPKSGPIPDDTTLGSYIRNTLSRLAIPPSVTSVRMMSVKEIATLNSQYRGKEGPTNVLSFPAGEVEDGERRILGDIAICMDVVEGEAHEQGKALTAHLAHMLIHGALHLCGHDHVAPDDAEEMEAIEVEIMADLGFGDPYDGR